jgi:hypothetical protein
VEHAPPPGMTSASHLSRSSGVRTSTMTALRLALIFWNITWCSANAPWRAGPRLVNHVRARTGTTPYAPRMPMITSGRGLGLVGGCIARWEQSECGRGDGEVQG